MFHLFGWISIAVGILLLILGLIGHFIGGSILISPRGCSLLSISFFALAANFNLLRIIKLREEGK